MHKPPTWGEITEFYADLATSPRYYVCGTGMLDLVTKIQKHPDFIAIQPALAHAGLTLRTQMAERSIVIDCDKSGYYNVYLDHCGDTPETYFGKMTTVAADEIVPTLLDYLERL